MTLQAYLDNIKAKTGMTPEDFLSEANKKGLLGEGVKTGEIVAWLKNDYGLGQGHAMAIVLTMKDATQPRLSNDERIDLLFQGEKTRWRPAYDKLVQKIEQFGPGISQDATNTYISILRNGKKFAIVQITGSHLEIGIKRKGTKSTERFISSGNWNSMVTHRVTINDPAEIDEEVISWLRQGYETVIPEKSALPK